MIYQFQYPHLGLRLAINFKEQRTVIRKQRTVFIFLLIILIFSGCVSLVEKTGQALDGSAFAEKQIALYRGENINVSVVENKNKEQSIIITIDNYPMLKIRGSYPLEDGEIQISSLEYLGSYVHGWNEYSMVMLGTGNLTLEGSSAAINITDIEQVQITNGRIHRYDTRITGNEALTALRNRNERIMALTEWMLSIEEGTPKGVSIKEFEKYWKPILLPEMVSRGQRPSGWRQKEDTFQRAESIRWNTGYTERVFPEELYPIRNSGTLLRDWEEALPWIYMEYEWQNIVELIK